MTLAEGGGGPGGGFGDPTLVGSERGSCSTYEDDDVATQIRH